jgi:tRNA nucleotidyltransferase/poly(A) polymerase
MIAMNVEKAALFIISTLQKKGFEAFYVGGCVRDKLLELPINDIDIATNASCEQIKSLFDKTIPVGILFGIIIVVVEGHNFEVATFRQDLEYADGRHPQGIIPATIEEDVKRRDFTINGLYFDPITSNIYDLVGGKSDIRNRLLKAIGDPNKRFQEDRLRLIRACRYAAVLKLTLEPHTQEAIINNAPFVKEGVSIERVLQELEKMQAKKALGQGLELMRRLGLLKPLFGQLALVDDAIISQRILKIGGIKPFSPLIFSLMVLFDVKTQKELEVLCEFFKMSKEAFKTGCTVLKWHDHHNLNRLELAELLSQKEASIFIQRQSLNEKNPPLFIESMKTLEQILQPVIARILEKTPIITATDLIEKGVPKGPRIKALMTKAMELFANSPKKNKEDILEVLKDEL